MFSTFFLENLSCQVRITKIRCKCWTNQNFKKKTWQQWQYSVAKSWGLQSCQSCCNFLLHCVFHTCVIEEEFEETYALGSFFPTLLSIFYGNCSAAILGKNLAPKEIRYFCSTSQILSLGFLDTCSIVLTLVLRKLLALTPPSTTFHNLWRNVFTIFLNLIVTPNLHETLLLCLCLTFRPQLYSIIFDRIWTFLIQQLVVQQK